jgi:hypothetical protein
VAPATASAAPSGDHAGPTWPDVRRRRRSPIGVDHHRIGGPREVTYAIGPFLPGWRPAAVAGRQQRQRREQGRTLHVGRAIAGQERLEPQLVQREPRRPQVPAARSGDPHHQLP